MTLTIKEIEHAQPRDRNWKLYDEKGLYLLVTPSGSRRWQFKYRFAGKEKKLSFGAWPETTLKMARRKRDDARALLEQGNDPSQERQAKKLTASVEATNTFAAIAREFIEKRAAEKIASTTLSKLKWLARRLEPTIGQVPVSLIDAQILMGALNPISKSGQRETARRLRSFASRVLDFAVITGRARANPAASLGRALLAPEVKHHAAIIKPEELRDLLRAIDSYTGYPSTIGALRLSAHLFQRPGEIRTMEWAEVDLKQRIWTIPASKMKMRKEHHVPLSRQAIAIIQGMRQTCGDSRFVFPAFHTPKTCMSENTVNQALRRMGYRDAMTAHGFRSTASSLLNECGKWSPDAIEAALAHRDQNAIRAIYNRTTYWDERCAMMQWWSDHLDNLGATDVNASGPHKGPHEPEITHGLARTYTDANHAFC